jgi:hypothetical protein
MATPQGKVHKDKGNDYFVKGKYAEALKEYSKGSVISY